MIMKVILFFLQLVISIFVQTCFTWKIFLWIKKNVLQVVGTVDAQFLTFRTFFFLNIFFCFFFQDQTQTHYFTAKLLLQAT